MGTFRGGAAKISFVLKLAVIASIALTGTRLWRSAGNAATQLPQVISASPTPGFVTCIGGPIAPGDGTKNLRVIGACTAGGGTYEYRNVNIYKDVAAGGSADGGSLTFQDGANIDFWAKSILIENHGALIAGAQNNPFLSPLTIHLWGVEQNKDNHGIGGEGIPCHSPVEGDSFCGIPPALWDSNPNPNPDSCVKASATSAKALPGGVDDCFYRYGTLPFDNGDANAFFGYKVLGVSFGGTLQLFGNKGATYCATYPCPADDPALSPSNTGTSWTRLAAELSGSGSEKQITVADPNGKIALQWTAGDKIVVGSTDYLPGHSELLTIAPAGVTALGDGTTLVNVVEAIQWPHKGSIFDFSTRTGISRLNLGFSSIDTRAPVGLLSRNIRIVSADTLGATSWPAAPGAFFGGHTIVRQGAKSVQIQGVELYQLGQGSKIGHYPVHFHMTRQLPPDTFVTDSSVWDSMTRWYVLHGVQGLTLQRDVGYLSIGHGYYLEDGTETNNRLYANLGIFARAAVLDPASVPLAQQHNPRQVPGILGSPYPTTINVPCGDNTCPCGDNPNARCGTPQEQVPYHSDIDHPTVFWIMNGWNDFEYNMADGAGTCGFCYWLVPGYISGHSRMVHWDGYAAEQRGLARAAMAPLETFYGNSCSTAMNSFNVVGNTSPCSGVVWSVDTALPRVIPVKPDPELVPTINAANPRTPKTIDFYPNVDEGGGHFGTRCSGANCATVNKCASGEAGNCMVNVLDHYTSSFNWAQTNVAAVWLRPQWNLFLQSAITDVQNGGITFVTGGDYTHSSAPPGVWELSRKSVYVGTTQPGNKWAYNDGPFNKDSGLTCDAPVPGSYCLSAKEEISMPKDNFAVNQRLFNIYDGPSYEDSSGYLDITPTTFTCTHIGNPEGTVGNCAESDNMYEQVRGVPRDTSNACYLPNAAIGWKQPNGFYYPPAFHSKNLYFDNVAIRHYVIEPSFLSSQLFQTDLQAVKKRYCNFSFDMFNNFSDVDRQTELNDDDGSLTGLSNTISVNQDNFFNAPYSTTECESDVGNAVPTNPENPSLGPGTANTSPYDYVSTVVFPSCGSNASCAGDGTPGTNWNWSEDCANNNCFGVPLYRELATGTEKTAPRPVLSGIRMMGESFFQRNTLTVNNGGYYLDTTVTKEQQLNLHAANFTEFQASTTANPRIYNVFFLFAKPGMKQSYSIYVGPGFNKATDLKMVRANIAVKKITFTSEPLPPAWDSSYENGILTVNVDMNFEGFINSYNAERMASCEPISFCKWTGDAATGTCGCNASATDYPDKNLLKECLGNNNANSNSLPICSWSVADVVCPKGGCYGFSFKMPGGFTNGAKPGLPPAASCFPGPAATPASPWNQPFATPTPASLAGSCAYGTVANPMPTPDFCP
jgi:G8 domain